MWFVPLLVGLALNIVSYLLQPNSSSSQTAEVEDMEDPTADAGRKIPKVYGTVRVSGLNVLWFGEKSVNTYMVKA